MPQGVHRDNLRGIGPLGKGTYVDGGLGVGKVRLVVHIKVFASDGERMVDGVRATMCTDCYARKGQNTERELML